MSVVVVVVVVVVAAVVLLFVFVYLRVLVCFVIQEAWFSVVRDASHRPKHCCARIEDRAYCGVKLHLATCCSWVGRWDDGLGALLLLRCCVLFVVAVVVAAVVLFLLVSIYVCLRVLVCAVIVEARRSVTRAGCRPPAPTLLCYY